MSIETNMDLARRWFQELWSKPDLDLADEIVAPDYAPDWIQIDSKGPAQVKHEIRYFRSVFPDLRYKIVDIIAREDRVWVRYKGSGTHEGTAWGFVRQVMKMFQRKHRNPKNIASPANTRVIQNGWEPLTETSQGCSDAQK